MFSRSLGISAMIHFTCAPWLDDHVKQVAFHYKFVRLYQGAICTTSDPPHNVSLEPKHCLAILETHLLQSRNSAVSDQSGWTTSKGSSEPCCHNRHIDLQERANFIAFRVIEMFLHHLLVQVPHGVWPFPVLGFFRYYVPQLELIGLILGVLH